MNSDQRWREAVAHAQGGRWEAAYQACGQLLQHDPNRSEAWHLLGRIAQRAGQPAAATDALRRAVALRPEVPEFHFDLGNALRVAGQLEEAVASYRQALHLRPHYADALVNLGIALANSNRREEAAQAWEAALKLDQGDVDALSNLSNLYRGMGRLEEAVDYAQRVLELSPNHVRTISNLGIALEQQGRLDEAIGMYRRAVALEPRSSTAHSNLLLALSYHPTMAPQLVFEEHLAWAQRHAAPLRAEVYPHANDRTPGRRLRIGYVSSDFRRHPVAFFLEPILACHDRERFEIVCYSGVLHPDEVTSRLRGYADIWHSMVGRHDADLAEQIRRDRIDILVDLSGHTAGRRMSLFARKPAPVQVTYLGYPNTTGLATMDWRITDADADPPGMTDPHYTERLHRLPRCAWCFRPPDEMALVPFRPLPPSAASADRAITFGCFNKHAKVSPQAMDAWAAILREVPGSRLLMKSSSMTDARTRSRTIEQFIARGVAPQRLELLAATATLDEHFAAYGRVDIALDTFPYNGTTTTCDALWCGVPVIVLAGQTHASRVGLSLLAAAGLPELVADTPEAYVRLATKLAGDPRTLGILRSHLSERVRSSPLADAPAMAQAVEAAYQTFWHAWCSTKT